MRQTNIAYAILDRLHYLLLVAAAALLYIYHPSDLSIFAIGAVGVYIAANELYMHLNARSRKRLSANVVKMLNITSQKRLIDFPLPVVIADKNGEVLWYNDRFAAGVDRDSLAGMNNVLKLSSSILSRQITKLTFSGHSFNVYRDSCDINGSTMNILYFIDMTDFKNLQKRYNLERPIIVRILVDNYDELFQKAKETEKSSAIAQIDAVLSDWAAAVGGLMRKTEKDSYLLICRNADLSEFIDKRFDILDKVKALNISATAFPTISIGIGIDSDTPAGNEESALAALDMALSRGGDQAVIKTRSGFEFFGGVSKGVEKRTKVKARVVANSFNELLSKVDKVLVMGHQYSDFDSLGACIGIARIAISRGKQVGIVFDKDTSPAAPLYEQLTQSDPEMAEHFVDPENALIMDGPSTLVTVVDTHRSAYTTMPSLLKYAGKTAVIDHHRKSADYIENADVFFHEPYASSACEMVAELVQYMNISKLPAPEAEALLSGIYLDTRDFTLKTSIYTFEAAAYLRKAGANTVNVKKLFQTDMQTYRLRIQMVANAEIYKKITSIAVWPETADASIFKVISAQAADEMLKIEGVKASFTIFRDKSGCVNISGRSLGDVNVQIILEKLNGGGHQTTAGAQIKTTLDKALQMLRDSIDLYIQDNPMDT